jgi:hypothetical protein
MSAVVQRWFLPPAGGGMPPRKRSARAAGMALLLFHFALSFVYSFSTPLWESHDETGHYAYARYISMYGRLPAPDERLTAFDETHQPPLYYTLVAAAIAGIDTADDVQPTINPQGWRRFMVYPAELDRKPWQGTALAVRIGRLVSIAFSTLAVACTFATGRVLFPRQPMVSLVATAIHAFWPLWLFLGSMITNDAAIGFFGSLTILITAKLIKSKPESSRLRLYVGLAVCLAAATATKDSAVSLVLFGCLVAVATAARSNQVFGSQARPSRFVFELLAFFSVLIIATTIGVLLSEGRTIRQFTTTIRYTSSSVEALVPNQITITRTNGLNDHLQLLLSTPISEYTRLIFDRMFGSFGWGTVHLPDDWYTVARISALLPAAGLIIGIKDIRRRKGIYFLVVFFITISLAPLSRALFGGNPYTTLFGRFFLPGLSALTLLISVGLLALPRKLNLIITCGILAGIGLVGIMTPHVVLGAVYQKPLFVMDRDSWFEKVEYPADITFGNHIQLFGYSFPKKDINSENGAWVMLYWRALDRMRADYKLRIELFGVDGQSYGAVSEVIPGYGSYPTTHWTRGEMFKEIYYLPIWEHVSRPTLATFKLTWFDPVTNATLRVTQDGQPQADAKVGSLPIRAEQRVTQDWLNSPAIATFGAAGDVTAEIDLVHASFPVSVTAGQPVSLSVVWRSGATDMPPLTMFAHLLSSRDGTLVGQYDSPPRKNQYPVDVWKIGEIVPDVMTIGTDASLSPGRYEIKIGIYTQNAQRLPVFTDSTAKHDNDVLTVGFVDVINTDR